MEAARVLLVEQSLPYRRLLREALTAFCDCEVDDTPDAENAFEMALRREYRLFLFALDLPVLDGELLDRLTAKAYPHAHAKLHAAPPIIYLLREGEQSRFLELKRNARVRGSISLPPRINAVLEQAKQVLPAREEAQLPPLPPS